MDENDLKRYTIILDGGSGVLFQPLEETKTYVLSAKHVFYKDVKNDGGPDTQILKGTITYKLSDNQNTPIEVVISKGENYFEHETCDAAILVLQPHLGFDQIFIDKRTTGFEGYSLTGYPNSKRAADDKYDKQIIRDLNSYSENIISLRLVVNHLDHEQITGFSGGGIIKTNGDSLLLSGIQSKTPVAECNGEIHIIPINKYEEIVERNNLSKLIPHFFSKMDTLLQQIIEFNETIPSLKPKLQVAIRKQSAKIKFELKDVYNYKFLSKLSLKSTSINSKQFWVSFLEYALIISLLEDNDLSEELLKTVSKRRKFIFSDSSKNIYDLYSDILIFASDDIDDGCQVLVATSNPPTTDKTRRILASKVPSNIANVDDNESIDRIALRSKIKEIIHIKAVELDCINKNDEHLDQYMIHQFEDILTEIKKLVHDFFNN